MWNPFKAKKEFKHADVDETDVKARLNDQIQWYDMSSMRNQRKYKLFKMLELFLAAAIPFISGLSAVPSYVVGLCGVLIVVLEGIQNLNQYHKNWISFRSTCEELKHHKFLWGTNSGEYEDSATPDKLLAENIESLISREHSNWVRYRKSPKKETENTNNEEHS